MTDQKSILVVDDIESIRFAIKDFLRRKYVVYEADNGVTALDILARHKIDLVITDIRMPEMGGLELIRRMKEKYPGIPHTLMTAYNVDDYIGLARKEKIWNIIPKTTFLDLRFIGTMVAKLLTGEIYGVEKYFPDLQKELLAEGECVCKEDLSDRLEPDLLYVARVLDNEESQNLSDRVARVLVKNGAPSVIRQILEELVSNARIRAPFRSKERDAETAAPPIELSWKPSTYSGAIFEISYGLIEDNVVIAVTDNYGSLDREEILYRLERQTTIDLKSGLPVGLGDLHGRGLFISREHLDHLIFNVEPGKQTEVIGILSLNQENRNRAISIYVSPSPEHGDPDEEIRDLPPLTK